MKLTCTVLMENTAREGLLAEHGLSFHLTFRGQRILLDTGATQGFAQNAAALGISLAQVDWAAVSHGHYDHAGGLGAFFNANPRAPVYLRAGAEGAHFSRKPDGDVYIGISRELWHECRERFVPLEEAFSPAPSVWLLPGTVSGGPFASREKHLLRQGADGALHPDEFRHEQSLVFDTAEGLVVLNSCCHGGVVNILRGVRELLPGRPLRAMVGGLHLRSPGRNDLNCPPEYVVQVADALLELGLEALYTGHCTGETAFALLRQRLGPRLHPLSAGQTLMF